MCDSESVGAEKTGNVWPAIGENRKESIRVTREHARAIGESFERDSSQAKSMQRKR
jgi:hypothetical protein